VYFDAEGRPPATLAEVIYGRSHTSGLPDVVSTAFQDGAPRCPGAFGLPGRQYAFNRDTTGVDAVILQPGRYWLAVVGEGGGRAFWASSDGPGSGLETLALPPGQ
jgi:hypothetical protein